MNTYLILKDLDEYIVRHLSPPTLLALSAVNTHYCMLLDLDRSMINKIKCNFAIACRNRYFRSAKWIYEIYAHIKTIPFSKLFFEHHDSKIDHIYDMFSDACINGHIEMAKYITDLNTNIDIHKNDEFIFRNACRQDQFKIVKWLVKLCEKSYGKINIHIHNDNALDDAITNNSSHMIQLLINLSTKGYGEFVMDTDYIYHSNSEKVFNLVCSIDHQHIIDAFSVSNNYLLSKNEWAFRWACYNGYLELAKKIQNRCGFINRISNEFIQRHTYPEITQWLISISERIDTIS